MMSCQLSCLLDGEGFPRKKKKKRRTRQGCDVLALNQFFFSRQTPALCQNSTRLPHFRDLLLVKPAAIDTGIDISIDKLDYR